MQFLKVKLLSITALLAILILQGCGWHLRGSEPLPPELQSLYLQIESKNSSFARTLRRSLQSMDVTLADSANDAPYKLKVSGIKNDRRTISTTGAAKVAEYALTSTITYSLNDQEGEQLIAPTQLSTEKSYLFNRNNATSASEEEELLRKEMQRELAQQLIRRYRAIKPAATVTTEAK